MGLADLVPANTPDRTLLAQRWSNAAGRIRKGVERRAAHPGDLSRFPEAANLLGKKQMRKALRCDRRPQSARGQEVPQRRHSFCGQRRIGLSRRLEERERAAEMVDEDGESLDAAIWTGLPGAYDRRSAIKYLKSIKDQARLAEVRRYVRMTPPQDPDSGAGGDAEGRMVRLRLTCGAVRSRRVISNQRRGSFVKKHPTPTYMPACGTPCDGVETLEHFHRQDRIGHAAHQSQGAFCYYVVAVVVI